MKNFASMIFVKNKPFGDKTAIIDQNGTRPVPWQELYQKSMAVAKYAMEKHLTGVMPVYMPRCAETVEALLGLVLAGVCPAPLSDHTPEARVRLIEEQSGNAAFTREQYDDALGYMGQGVGPANFADDAPAYMIYTSGSTGEPKGVMLPNSAMEKSIRRIAGENYFGYTPADRVLQHAPFAFIALILDMFAPLYAGVPSYILPDEALTDMAETTAFINRYGITATFMQPKLLPKLGDCPSLRMIVVGSERVADIGPKNYRVVNCWGLTESAGLASYYDIPAFMEKPPVGKIHEDFRCYVLDDDNKPAKEGELCLSGAIALGYYKLPDLTAKTFIENPFSTDEGHRVLLRTGDIVRQLPDGNLEYVNRKDFMIKINGQRAEPGEAEAVIKRIPGVTDAAVKGFTDPDGHSYLCAYYVSGGAVGEDALREELKKHLPDYMIPSFITELDALPLNANNKLDRSALPAPELSGLHSEYVEPATPEEAAIAKAFEDTLSCGRVGAEDDFFRLGGDSIRAMTVVSAANISSLDTAAVLSGRTPRGIARLIDGSVEDPYVGSTEKPGRAPLTDSQMGVYLECAEAPESLKYNIPFSIAFPRTKKMTAAFIKACVDKVLALHPALNARIEPENGEVYMVRVPFPEEGLCSVRSIKQAELEQEWSAFIRPFVLSEGPLCRVEALLTRGKVHLLLDTHHIVSDGTSVVALLRGLVAAFSGEEPAPEQVDAFALYGIESKRIAENADRAKQHFSALLGGVETDSNLLFDKKSDLTDAPADRVTLTLDNIDFSFLRRNGITESTFFMSVYGYALAKMTGQSDSLFAVAESGRKGARKSGVLSDTVTMMVRTLPVYMQVDEKKSALDCMTAVKSSFYASMKNDTASFRELCGEFGIKPGVVFVYQGDMLSDRETALGPTELRLRTTGRAVFNLSTSVFRDGDAHHVVFEYRSDLYNRSTVERFAEIYKNAARVFAENRALESIPLIGEKDLAFLDAANAATESPYDPTETVVAAFEKRVHEHPDKACVVFENRQYTYAEADDITNRIAAYVRSLGIGKDGVVSVLIPRSEYMFLCAMGIMKAGAIYQPLDPSYPADRLSFMRQDAASALLIADRALLPILTDFDGRVLFTDEIQNLPAPETALPLPSPEDGYILLYTSGTTGLPKGVRLLHRNLTAFIHGQIHLTEMTAESVSAAYASYGFDANMADMYPIVSLGGTLVIVPDEIRLDLPAVKDYIEAHKVTHTILTTQLAVQFVLAFKELTYLKCLVTGGEKLVSLEPPRTYRLINAYGPTEATVCETAFPVDKLYEDIPIGTAMLNTHLYVVDPVGRRLPVGVPGELIIAGPQVGAGYLNRPEQTAKAFVPNTFEENVPAAYNNCYRTGDIVRFVDDGNIMFIGRRDMQVKIRGFRIELSEVERVIRDFPGIENVTVVARDAAAGGKCLNAYIVGREPIDIGALNDYIRSVKPPYMVPAATMQIDAIPLTVNGKVDKRKLPVMEVHFEDESKPETELQKEIFALIEQVLGAGGFGIRTNLFDAGLSSLGSIRLCSLLADTYQIPFRLRDLKKHETVEKLEAYIKESRGETGDAAKATDAQAKAPKAPEAAEIRYGKDYPISKTMEGIFTECSAKPDSTFYNIPTLMKLSPEVDEARLKAAFASAVEAHPTMKAELFTDSEGRVRQHCRLDNPFTAADIETLTAESIEDLKPQLVKPFPLTNSRLFTVSLIRADGLYLFMDFHHIIADGTSVTVFLSDVEKAYAGETLTPESYTAFDVAADEEAARTPEEIAAEKDYYEKLLEGLDHSFLPAADKYADMAPASGKLLLGGTHADPEAIRRFCAGNRVGLNAYFVAAFGITLSRYAGSDYAVFNTIYNGRTDSRAAGTFGMLVKTLPVVFRGENVTCKEAVTAMSAQLTDSMMNDLYSYGEIVRSFDVTGDVMFIYQGEGFDRSAFCGGPVENVSLALSGIKVPLSLQAMIKDGKIAYDMDYNPERFTERFAEAFVSAFDMALAGLCVGETAEKIGLLSPEAEAEIEQYNNTEHEYDRSRTITDLFLEQAKAQPDALCVAYKDKRLTYRKVDELSGKIAGFLMKKGISRDDVVAILINRNENMVVTAHGVVRAGAAYLGLDPTYPSDRLEFMIKDSGSKYLIAERELMDRIPGYRGEVLYTDEIDALHRLAPDLEEAYRATPKHAITPENRALIVYSSGTTGLPKGSVLQHKAIVCFFENYRREVELGPDANVATYASFGFDGGAQDVFCAPMSGSALFVIPDEVRLDPVALEQFYVRNAITNGFMTTQVGTMFIANTKCRTLKHFMVGGEKFIPVMAPEWVNFRNGYGPSETMCYVNLYRIKDTGSLQPIGTVNDNIKEYIIDKAGNRLPFGACGELCISGGQMGLGYLNRPEKTAASFVKNPFSDKEGYERMYRTGDIVRLLPDGNYDFVGRNDGQVKVRGFRIELGEVEGQIRKFPGVIGCVVTAFDNPSGGKALAAYVVTEGDFDAEKLKTFIASEKPDYMVPAVILQIDEIPLTSNGKVDKRKLPKPELRSARKGAEPADETERKLCAIFGEVLGIDKVYADDDFFKIGGSSISAIRVIVKCEQAGMKLVYKDLFANPTPQKLAAFLFGGEEHDIIASELEKGDGHNYSALAYNIPENLPAIENKGIGDVLLTGATGFLGSHVFRELLDATGANVTCIIRSKDGMTAEQRLEMMMVYYFEEWYGEEQSRRVTVVDADLGDEKLDEKLASCSFDTIINCAASVKHFAAGDELIGSNFTSVEALISLAEKRGVRLIQASSLSVCGESVNGSVPNGYLFKETDLNIGQSLENKYVYSKYLAEQAIIDAVSNGRLQGKIIRLGNLMARYDDSEFQVNAGTNGFLRMFLGFHALGCFPIGMMDAKVEFSPIDAVAQAMVLLSGTPDAFTVFHAKNCNTIHYGYFISAMRSRGCPIEIVEDSVFEERLEKALENEKAVESLGGLLAYRNTGDVSMTDSARMSDAEETKKDVRVRIASDTTFTTRALYRLGFAWPLISKDYLDKMVDVLMELNYFSAL